VVEKHIEVEQVEGMEGQVGPEFQFEELGRGERKKEWVELSDASEGRKRAHGGRCQLLLEAG
jgi:hypothetical protein